MAALASISPAAELAITMPVLSNGTGPHRSLCPGKVSFNFTRQALARTAFQKPQLRKSSQSIHICDCRCFPARRVNNPIGE
jgi:hypothetical protein